MKTTSFSKLNSEQQRLLLAAKEVAKMAYNPYSHFYVGAALLSKDKKIITGANMENAAYNPTICAERSALAKANSEGIRKFSKIAVIANADGQAIKDPVSPCGTCRQMLYEAAQVSGNDIEVIMSNTKMTKIIIASTKELLPLAFGPAKK